MKYSVVKTFPQWRITLIWDKSWKWMFCMCVYVVQWFFIILKFLEERQKQSQTLGSKRLHPTEKNTHTQWSAEIRHIETVNCKSVCLCVCTWQGCCLMTLAVTPGSSVTVCLSDRSSVPGCTPEPTLNSPSDSYPKTHRTWNEFTVWTDAVLH